MNEKEGKLYPGIGIGVMIFNQSGELFLAKRGKLASNEQGKWDLPGGRVEMMEPMEDAAYREVAEETGMKIQIIQQLGAFDHILQQEKEHWISIAYIARHVENQPYISEPEKCDEIGWFKLETLPQPLTEITMKIQDFYGRKFGYNPFK